MKVRMLVSISGTRNGSRWPEAGETLTCSSREGSDLCAQGYAEPIAEKPEARAEKRRKR